ncbi:molybdenum cofactor biosynthesis protein MoaE [Helicobacter sp. 12S02634-8]|uniref:molybdenum cofactor biosynthesis protein MoaE n=1 Tax=Helicobacter sp. 12S02634-8 TaxID=1476199 RepID=UPI000BA795DE|nr:molybdenum cofactor biosynthesis protein MoaE [Helicobacter sp. 12S02634-8]PAF48600.1 molybdenum cofactor biosynthesis protein MoaE [Helicobacter sp. 12S02634-8]
MLEIYEGALPTMEIYQRWEVEAAKKNFGAFCLFVGIVREENGIDGLSFDVYEPIFLQWFKAWQERALQVGAILKMAHARGDVYNTQSSYMSAVLSKQRKPALGLYGEFIEDFKHKAPIWKYDLKGNQRIYAQERSHLLPGSGILS